MNHYPDPCTITVSRFYFTVKWPTPRVIQAVYALSHEYTQLGLVYDYKTKRRSWKPIKTFGLYVDHGIEFRFHIGQLKEFLELLRRNNVDQSSYSVIYAEDKAFPNIDLPIKSHWKFYGYQNDAHSFVVDDNSVENSRPLVIIPPGFGKTLIASRCASTLGKRLAVACIGGYVDKWTKDLQDNLDIDKSEICVIKGADSLQRASFYPTSGLPLPKAFVISINTTSKWYDLYEESKTNPLLEAYGCLPENLMSHLGIGTVVMDEVHQHPFAVFRFMCYNDALKTISLTATLLSKEQTIRRLQSMMFPQSKRFDDVELPKYAYVHACGYQIMNFSTSKLQTTEFNQTSYSHAAFENSIMSKRQRVVKSQYYKMILDLADRTYVKNRVDGDKLAIYVFTKQMAKELVEEIKERFPQFDTRWYLHESDYEDVHEPDIRVTTVLKAGTAIDIKGLRYIIQTISMDSPNANVQCLGRLREIKNRTHDNDVHYYQIYCTGIKKHLDYHANRSELFKNMIKEQSEEFLGTIYPSCSN